MMLRFLLLLFAISLASTAVAERTFYASSIDIEQNERLDAIDQRVERIESNINIIAAKVSESATLASDQVVQAKPQPKPVETTVATIAKPVQQSLTVVSSPLPSQPARQSSNYYSQAELIGIVRAAYPSGNYTKYADVSPRSSVWNHLQDGNHQFTAAQVSGLPQDIALGLHGLHHANLIRATRGTGKVAAPAAQPQPLRSFQTFTPQATIIQAGRCANGRCPTPARPQPTNQQRFRIFPRLGR